MSWLSAGAHAQPTRYLFIDGASLRETCTVLGNRYFGTTIPIDHTKLGAGWSKIYYYDGLPPVGRGEEREKYEERIRSVLDEHKMIARLPRYHVVQGDMRDRSKQGRGIEQKMVDIAIAVDMLTHTFRRNMDHCSLLASDLDFKPLIDALVREGMEVSLLYDPLKTNSELIEAADVQAAITIVQAWGWAPSDFQRQNPIPYLSTGPLKLHDSVRVDGNLYAEPQGWNFVGPQSASTGPEAYYSMISGENLDAIRLIAKDLYGLDVPPVGNSYQDFF